VTTVVAKDLMDEAWVLCFDEFQVTDVATASLLKGVLSEMFRMGAVMITTSNRVPADLVKGQYQKEFYRGFSEMLAERCEVHEIRNTEDYRKLIGMESLLEGGEMVYYRKDIPKEDRLFMQRVTDMFYGKQGIHIVNVIIVQNHSRNWKYTAERFKSRHQQRRLHCLPLKSCVDQ